MLEQKVGQVAHGFAEEKARFLFIGGDRVDRAAARGQRRLANDGEQLHVREVGHAFVVTGGGDVACRLDVLVVDLQATDSRMLRVEERVLEGFEALNERVIEQIAQLV